MPPEVNDTLAVALIVAGCTLTVIGYLWHFHTAFRRGTYWGFGCLLVPGVSFVFIAAYTKNVWKPPAVVLFGLACVGLALWMLRIPQPH